ncbi:uncharacterized protein J3D65DRAFT_632840 [Phyllosticta citribraziliensis]|uniref:Uncharacterized protein n=1 Tax=Phyllosticta citribraziliensis TaxID=989973 RepID=A0ABR1LG97_9PEZI
MSVTTSSASVDPPPLLFGQRSPSPPVFHAFSQNGSQSPRSPSAPTSPRPPANDSHMSANAHVQSSESEDSEMEEDSMDSFDGALHQGLPPADSADEMDMSTANVFNLNPTSTNAPPPAPVDHDAMDTTPDSPGALAFADASSSNTVSATTPQSAVVPPPPPPPQIEEPLGAPRLVRVNSHGSSVDSMGYPGVHPSTPPPTSLPPPPVVLPPPPGPSDSPREEGSVMEPDESSDDEDAPRWHEMGEDRSAPDEVEIKEIEAAEEFSAHDHAHWEAKTFVELDDPEYKPGPSGRLEWTVNNFNGTKENPNKELVMKSPVARVAGYDWQIKFYPRGNDTDSLSIYVECLSVKKKKTPESHKSGPQTPSSSSTGQPQSSNSGSVEYRSTPIPLLGDTKIPKRPSVAAQVAVVLYNPNEPRVNFYRSCAHRFCPDSPDWGWTRFHGPHYEIHYRHRGQRQALLRNDTLAFRAYIRTVNDATECLWEHHSGENSWDSFAMTGLHSMCANSSGLLAAIWPWLTFKPFRQFLYSAHIPHPEREARATPKPLLTALIRTVYKMRCAPWNGKREPIDLEYVAMALEWYGETHCFEKMDVIEVWEVLRAKLEIELRGTPLEGRLDSIFGPERDRTLNTPTYRAAIKGCGDVQAAVDKARDLIDPTAPPPELLHIELERQEFDEGQRSVKKLADKVKILDRITANRTPYILHGFIAHRDSLQSGCYYAVVRPRGPGTKWYAHYDDKDSRVACITKQQAIDKHEGGGSEKSAVAYILLYIRQDIVHKQFSKEESTWDIPDWLPHDDSDTEVDLPLSNKPQEYKVFLSTAFDQHEGPGVIDPTDSKWATSECVRTLQFSSNDSVNRIRHALADEFGIEDARRINFWSMDYAEGSAYRPVLKRMVSGEAPHCPRPSDPWMRRTQFEDSLEKTPGRWIWAHIAKEDDVPRDTQKSSSSSDDGQDSAEDTPMSDREDDVNENMDLVITEGLAAQAARLHHQLEGDQQAAAQEVARSRLQLEFGIAATRIEEYNSESSGTAPQNPKRDSPTTPANPKDPYAWFSANVNPRGETYVMLKVFDAEASTLKAHSSFVVKFNDRVEASIRKILGWDASTALELWDEAEILATRSGKLSLRPTTTFGQTSIVSPAVLIANVVLPSSSRSSLASAGLFTSADDAVQHALRARFATRTTPPLTGHFTLDYFSSEHYVGLLRNGRPHGHGRRIYFDGSHYSGPFCLGERQGACGSLTFANGDVYTGAWAADAPHGVGSLVERATGNAYHGGWRAGKRFGEGVTHWRQAQEVERLCRICWEDPADAAFYDCGHVVACLNCARRVDACPVCRRRVLSAMRLFFGN